MQHINKFDWKGVLPHHIAFAFTAENNDMGMDRIFLLEGFPNYGHFTIVNGGHCSCYNFNEVKWDARVFKLETEHGELKAILQKWFDDGLPIEQNFARTVIKYLNLDRK